MSIRFTSGTLIGAAIGRRACSLPQRTTQNAAKMCVPGSWPFPKSPCFGAVRCHAGAWQIAGGNERSMTWKRRTQMRNTSFIKLCWGPGRYEQMANQNPPQRRSTSREFKPTWPKRFARRRSIPVGSSQMKNGTLRCAISLRKSWRQLRATSFCRSSFRL